MSHRRDIGQKTGAADVVDGLGQGQRHRVVAQRGKGGDHPLPIRLPQGHRADRGRHLPLHLLHGDVGDGTRSGGSPG